MAVAPDRDESPDPDDALFARAFDHLAGPVPDGRAGWADLRARVPATPSRRAPRVAVVVAAAVTVAFVGVVTRRASEHGGPLLQPPLSTATSTATARATVPVRSSSTASVAGPSATVPAAAPSTDPTWPTPVGDDRADVDPPPAPDGTSSDRARTTPSPRARGATPPAAPGTTAPAPEPSAPAGPDTTVTPAPTAPAAPAVGPQRLVVEGGTIVVALVDGRFGVPSVIADAGWSYEVRKAEADRIEVRFRNGDREASVRLSPRSDGTVLVERH